VQALREGGRGTGARTGTRRALVVAEIAVALVLLASAGLLTRSFEGMRRIDVGFEPRNLVTMRVTLAGPRYREEAAIAAYYAEAIRRISAIPGVGSAAAILSLPVGGGGFYLGRGFIRPDIAHPPEGYNTGFQIATPGYFRTMGMTLVAGRDFDEHDIAAAVPVTVVSRTLAERFFPGENAVGQKVLVVHDEQAPRQIVGVVGDLKSEEITAAAGAEMYVPLAQSPSGDMTFVVRTDAAPAAAIPAVKKALQAFDPTQATFEAQTFDEVMRNALAEERFSLIVFASFALLAVGLAAVGLYGVMSYVVTGRAHEMGVRMALGARPAEVRRLVVGQGLALLGIGLLIGLPASVAAGRLLGQLLYGVHPADPLTLAGVVVVISVVTWVSTYLPARRATRVDPATVLRGD